MLRITIRLFMVLQLAGSFCNAQAISQQQGLLLKSGTNIRLGSVRVLDKRTGTRAMSNTAGVFNIAASIGDTLTFSADNLQKKDVLISDFNDKIIYLDPAIQLNEVAIRENALKNNINEAMRGYREKSVFYNGNPHYYYLVLKPMTFIYENFKSEKKFARRFAKYARKEIAANEVGARFNDDVIKKSAPVKDSELEDFRLRYSPSVQELRKMSDYDLIRYIRNCYEEFKRNEAKQGDLLRSRSGNDKTYEALRAS